MCGAGGIVATRLAYVNDTDGPLKSDQHIDPARNPVLMVDWLTRHAPWVPILVGAGFLLWALADIAVVCPRISYASEVECGIRFLALLFLALLCGGMGLLWRWLDRKEAP